MRQTADLNYAGAALSRLGILYRDLPCRNGELYFCTIPSNGITFDLQYSKDGTIRLWRFVSTTTISKAGVRCEYRKQNYPHAVIGIEVTDEGDISLFAEQKIDGDDPRSEARFLKMLHGYTELIDHSSIRNISL